MEFLIRKSSGKREPFQEEKFRRSLQRIGASEKTIQEIIALIQKELPNIRSTKELFHRARNYLAKTDSSLAIRYNIKEALLQLGPTGYPLESFIAALFAHEGFKVTTDQLVAGKCVQHEIDVIAVIGQKRYMIESKFHNNQRYKSDVKVPLYIKARFEDIQQAWQRNIAGSQQFTDVWIVTNTEFSTDAIQYALCEQMHLMSWNYPEGYSLRELINKHHLHPVTALIHLTGRQKRFLLNRKIILCRDLLKHQHLLKEAGVPQAQIATIVDDIERICRT